MAESRYGRQRDRTGRRKSGAVAVEFAIVMVPFMLVLMGVFETALIMYTDSVVSARAASFGRQVRTGQFTGTTASEVKTFFCSGNILYDCDNRARIHVMPLPRRGTPLPDAITAGVYTLGGDRFDQGAADDIVVARFFYEYRFVHIGVQSAMKNLNSGHRLIEGSTAFRSE